MVQATPPRDADNEVPERTQMPEETDHEMFPPDCPPVAVNDKFVPVTNDAKLEIKNPDCEARPIVMVVFAEFTAK